MVSPISVLDEDSVMASRVLPLIVVSSFFACTFPAPPAERSEPADAGTADRSVDAGSSSDGRTDRDDAGADAGPPPPSCELRGQVLDGEASVVEGMSVFLCAGGRCYLTETDSAGAFDHRYPTSSSAVLELGGSSTGHISLNLPIAACSGGSRDLDVISVLAISDEGPIVHAAEGGTAQVHPELSLQLPPGMQFPDLDPAAYVRALRVDPALMHPLMAAQLDALLCYAIEPYASEAPGASIGFEISAGLEPGRVAAYYMDYHSGLLQLLFEADVQDGGVVSSPDQGLPALTWLCLRLVDS